MLTELSRLIDVQEIDKVIQEVTQGLAKLPEELKAGEAALEELKAAHATRLQELEDLKAQRRDTEMEMAEMAEGIKNSRQRLMEIKSNIEYKAMLKEIAFKEDQRDQRETRILQFMDRMETQNRLIAEQMGQIEEQEATLVQQRQAVAVQVAKLQRELAEQEERRKKVRKAVPAPLMKRYEFIRQRRNSSAVCPVHEGVCLGCHMNILPQQFIDLQKGLEILQCPHCQRILYWADEVEEAGATSHQAS
ncbi:MAG: C4-type zinc ribbon domain-containing protein [Deltaproteobacteria bacterium]|nr:C4-type zinc ribbon domain-containing protein [Deltaproteobacteria bacterium]